MVVGLGWGRACEETVRYAASLQMCTSVRPVERTSTPRATRWGPDPTSVPSSVLKANWPSRAEGAIQAADLRRLTVRRAGRRP